MNDLTHYMKSAPAITWVFGTGGAGYLTNPPTEEIQSTRKRLKIVSFKALECLPDRMELPAQTEGKWEPREVRGAWKLSLA